MIKSLQEWNSRLVMSSCCEMPEHLGVQIDSLYCVGRAIGYGCRRGVEPQFYLAQVTTYADGSTKTLNYNRGWQAFVGSPEIEVPLGNPAKSWWTGGTTMSSPVSIDYRTPVNLASAIVAADAAIRAGMDFNNATSTSEPIAKRQSATEWGQSWDSPILKLWSSRYRIGTPEDFPENHPYYLAEWDEVFFPAATPTEGTILRSLSWQAPAGGGFSEWHDLPAPTTDGTVEIRNLRVTSYRSPHGTKPTFHSDEWP